MSTGSSIQARSPACGPPPSSRNPIHAPVSAETGIHQAQRLNGPSNTSVAANSATGASTPHAPKRQAASSETATAPGTTTQSEPQGSGGKRSIRPERAEQQQRLLSSAAAAGSVVSKRRCNR